MLNTDIGPDKCRYIKKVRINKPNSDNFNNTIIRKILNKKPIDWSPVGSKRKTNVHCDTDNFAR